MKRQKITVEKREVLGKKVKKLRKSGIIPANIYGKDIKSLAVQLPYQEFEKLFKEVGETGLLDVQVGKEVRPVLIHNVQYDHLTRLPVHADFFQVNLKEKVKTMVPVILVGEAKAVSEKVGILLQTLSEIEVEALPENLPENIEVHVEHLANLDEQIAISDIKTPKDVEIVTDPGQVIVKVIELVSKEAKEQAVAEAAAADAAKVASDATKTESGESGITETPTEGEKAEAPEQAPKEETNSNIKK